MNNTHERELRAAQARQAAINEEIAALQAESMRLDKLITSLTPTIGSADLPCWECKSQQAVYVRHMLRNNSNPRAPTSLSGLPQNCCRIGTFESRSSVAICA
jgi:hypothetical protein